MTCVELAVGCSAPPEITSLLSISRAEQAISSHRLGYRCRLLAAKQRSRSSSSILVLGMESFIVQALMAHLVLEWVDNAQWRSCRLLNITSYCTVVLVTCLACLLASHYCGPGCNDEGKAQGGLPGHGGSGGPGDQGIRASQNLRLSRPVALGRRRKCDKVNLALSSLNRVVLQLSNINSVMSDEKNTSNVICKYASDLATC